MRYDILMMIRNDINIFTYLKYHSYWYKLLLRNPDSISSMISEMKKEYKLTTADKLSNMNNKLKTIRTFLEVLK